MSFWGVNTVNSVNRAIVSFWGHDKRLFYPIFRVFVFLHNVPAFVSSFFKCEFLGSYLLDFYQICNKCVNRAIVSFWERLSEENFSMVRSDYFCSLIRVLIPIFFPRQKIFPTSDFRDRPRT